MVFEFNFLEDIGVAISKVERMSFSFLKSLEYLIILHMLFYGPFYSTLMFSIRFFITVIYFLNLIFNFALT